MHVDYIFSHTNKDPTFKFTASRKFHDERKKVAMVQKNATSNRDSVLTSRNIPFFRNWILQLIIITFVVFWVVMALFPTNRMQWLLENLLLVATLIVLIFTYRQYRFSNLSYLCMFIFLCLHTYAAHYTYQSTPFDDWLKNSFHLQRSYFDRVVHFSFGLFLYYPIREGLTLIAGLRGLYSYAIPVAILLSLSSLFEIIEMIVALIAGQVGQAYLGLQGDIYDTQKDMGMGFAGSLISMGCLAWIHKKLKLASMLHSSSPDPLE